MRCCAWLLPVRGDRAGALAAGRSESNYEFEDRRLFMTENKLEISSVLSIGDAEGDSAARSPAQLGVKGFESDVQACKPSADNCYVQVCAGI